MILEPLYKRAANGAVRKWEVIIEGDTYIRISGQLNGSFTEVRDTVIGKVNRTNEEQAESEALSYWKKQKDNGYKTMLEIGCEAEEDLYHILPQYNTDAQGNIKPMLAKAIHWNKIKYPVYIQPKLDGVRCLMKVKDGEVTFTSRSGKPYTTLSHIENEVLADGENFILDGEIYSPDISFQEIISAVKLQGPNSEKLHFRAYDTVEYMDQVNRLRILENYIKKMNFKYIHFVETHIVYNEQQIRQFHSAFVSDGNEGAMIRDMNGKYQQGIRSSYLRKVKEFNEEEFHCNKLIEGKREEDVIAVCLTKEGKEFKAKMMGTREDKEELVKLFQPGLLTVKFFGWTDDKIPRFPIGKTLRNYE